MSAPEKEYLGDSVYVQFDGFYIILTTENGYPDDPRNQIELEPKVLQKLHRFETRVDEYRAAVAEEQG